MAHVVCRVLSGGGDEVRVTQGHRGGESGGLRRFAGIKAEVKLRREKGGEERGGRRVSPRSLAGAPGPGTLYRQVQGAA